MFRGAQKVPSSMVLSLLRSSLENVWVEKDRLPVIFELWSYMMPSCRPIWTVSLVN